YDIGYRCGLVVGCVLALVIAFSANAGASDVGAMLDSLETSLAAIEAADYHPPASWRELAEELREPAAVFSYVQKLRYEPYFGRLLGGEGAFRSGAANNLDRGDLLRMMLGHLGVTCRFAAGRLSGEQLDRLLRAVPSTASHDKDEIFTGDETIRMIREKAMSRIADHYWVQAEIDGKWVDLDASFPDAAFGEAVCKSLRTFDAQPPELEAEVTVRVRAKYRMDGQMQTGDLLEHTIRVGDLAGIPVTLFNVVNGFDEDGTFRLEQVQPILKIGSETVQGQVLAGGAGDEGGGLVPAGRLGGIFAALDDDSGAQPPSPGLELFGQWLEVTIQPPSQPTDSFTRTLFEGTGGKAAPVADLLQVTALEFSPEKVRDEWFQADVRSALPTVRAGTAALRAMLENKPDAARGEPSEESARNNAEAMELQQAMAWFLTRTFRLNSDKGLSDGEKTSGLAAYRARPVAILGGIACRPGAIEYSLDLRRNEIEFFIPSTRPVSWAAHLQLFRGLYECRLEGAVMKSFTGKTGLAAGDVLAAAKKNGVEVRWLSRDDITELGQWQLPPAAARAIQRSLSLGFWVCAPRAPVEVAGADRYAWFELNPNTGRLDSVFDNGRHQGMIEDAALKYVLGVVMGDAMGYYLSMEVGFNYGMIAGLKYFLDCSLQQSGEECFGSADVCGPAKEDAHALCDLFGKFSGVVGLNPLPFLGIPDFMTYFNGDPCHIGAALGMAWFGCGA
ncbi:hypothetical protein JW905_02760, partial [bacterium]|nr:hypothetical protein [candidate division CSSED10-310 bacterium]